METAREVLQQGRFYAVGRRRKVIVPSKGGILWTNEALGKCCSATLLAQKAIEIYLLCAASGSWSVRKIEYFLFRTSQAIGRHLPPMHFVLAIDCVFLCALLLFFILWVFFVSVHFYR